MFKNFVQTSILLILFAYPVNLIAATIKGRVIDSNTHETIIGATILVENQKYFALSDALGNYTITDLPVGKYVVHAKSMGYKDFYTQEIAIANNNEIVTFDIYLKPVSVELTEVEITEKSKATDASARNTEKNAQNIINVVSAKTIELSPDLTVANVIQRMSGVTLERSNTGDGQYAILRGMDKRFNYTMVNGIKIPSPDNKNRFVPLDIFPSELLDRLEVNKSLTANMEGDGIGGAVNMVMKDAPSNRMLTANLGTGYNSLFLKNEYQSFDVSAINAKSPSEKYGLAYPVQMKDFTTKNLHLSSGKAHPNLTGGFSFGDRFLKEKLGFILAGSYQNSIRGNSSDLYSTSTNNDGQQDITHRFFSNQQTRMGLHAKFDMRLSENHKLMWYNAYMNFTNTQVRDAISSSSQTTRLRWNRQTILNSTLKGIHNFNNAKLNLDWSLSYGNALNETPDNVQINELVINGITGIKQDGGASRRWEHNSDKDLAGNGNLQYRFNFNNDVVLDLSTGGTYRNKVRGSYFNEYLFNPQDQSKPPANQGEEIRGVDYHNFDEVMLIHTSKNISDPLNYDASEKIGAVYLMEKLSLKKLQFIAGVRAEYTNQGYNLKFTTENARNEGNQEYVDILPSFNVKYAIHKNANLRLSYAKGINRPSFFEIVPYSIINEEYKERGNPDLKHTKADNFDLRYEFFPHSLEQYMIGFFYKKIKDPIEFGFKSYNSQDLFYMPMNYGNANNYGVEVDVIKYFDWFGIKANYTYTNSDITTSKKKDIPNPDPNAETNILTIHVDQTRPLFGQAEHVANLSILFKDMQHGWDGQLAFAYTGDRISVVSSYLDDDTWQSGYFNMDASIEKRFKSGLAFFGKASNLLNSPMVQYKRNGTSAQAANFETYHGWIIDRKERYGLNISIGLKYKFQ